MIIYIHGFGSSGFGGKATIFKKQYGNILCSPSLSYVPTLAINTLEQLIEISLANKQEVNLIGSSLGGFYALYLANKYELKAVLINPSIFPYKTLDKIGLSTNYFDMSSFEVTPAHIESLKQYEVEMINNEKRFMVLLQKEDEVLNYKEAILRLPKSHLHVEEGGSHSFDGVERYFERIENFFKN